MDNTKRLELKNQALLEKVGSLTTNYENQVADLRVEVTMLMNELAETREALTSLANSVTDQPGVEDEVPDKEAPAAEQG